MKYLSLVSSLVFLATLAFGQNIDALKNASISQSGKQLTETYIKISQISRKKSQDSALYYADKAISVATNSNYQKGEVMAYIQKAKILNSFRKPKEGRTFADKALETIKSYDLDSLLADAYSTKANSFMYDNAVAKSIEFYYKALEEYKRINSTEGIIKIEGNIGLVYDKMGEFEKAKQIYMQSANSMEQKGLLSQSVRVNYMLARLGNKMSEYDSSLHYAEKTIRIGNKISSDFAKVKGYLVGGNALIKLGDYNKAFVYLDSAHAIAGKLGMKTDQINATIEMGYGHHYAGNQNKAIEIGNDLASQSKVYNEIATYILLYKAHKANGNYKEALNWFEKMKSIQDSAEIAMQKTKIEELQTRFDTQTKEAEIADLSKQSRIQQLEIQTRNQWLIFGSIAFLTIIGGIYFWNQQRIAKEKASRAEVEQRFLRSQLNPHFIFNSLDSIHSYIMTNEAPKAGQYLSKFAKLMRQVLENSREQFISLDEEIAMLQNYMELQKLRPESNFEYSIHLAENIESDFTSIPPMFVQPFVENAIEHGVINGDGNIVVNFEKQGELVNISVSDNGIGLSASKMIEAKKIEQHNSLSTSIIKERIESYNEKLKTNIQLLVSEMIDDGNKVLGTRVELKVPYQEG